VRDEPRRGCRDERTGVTGDAASDGEHRLQRKAVADGVDRTGEPRPAGLDHEVGQVVDVDRLHARTGCVGDQHRLIRGGGEAATP
jgi:hypothetical protein